MTDVPYLDGRIFGDSSTSKEIFVQRIDSNVVDT